MIESCIGQKKKQEICSKYYVRPIAFTKLLNGQTKNGCCGLLTDRYYTFGYTDPSAEERLWDYFFVGHHCASDLLSILGLPPLPLFNPLSQTSKKQYDINDDASASKSNVHPLNKELISAINLLCISWNTIPKSRLGPILEFTRNRMSQANTQGVLRLNEIIARDRRQRTLRQMINELAVHNELRNFEFKTINELIDSKGIENRIR